MGHRARLAVVLVLFALSATLSTGIVPVRAEPALPYDLKDIRLEDFGVKPVVAQKDDATGFVVGGRNSTSVIQVLTAINGRPIADLEADMRPDPSAYSGVRSRKGFLGPDEKLIEVLAADNRYVVDERR